MASLADRRVTGRLDAMLARVASVADGLSRSAPVLGAWLGVGVVVVGVASGLRWALMWGLIRTLEVLARVFSAHKLILLRLSDWWVVKMTGDGC